MKTKEMNMRNTLIFLPLIFLVSISYSQDKINTNNTKQPKICLKSNEFYIGRFYYGQDSSLIKNILGKPDSIIVDQYTPSKTWFYKDIRIGISNDHVYYISTNSEKYGSPSGIKINMTLQRISELIEIDLNKYLYENKSVQLVNCDNSIPVFILYFDRDFRLEKLEIGIDLP